MNAQNIKIYPLPSGEYIVSYFDPARRGRLQKRFGDENSARSFYQDLRVGPAAKKTKVSDAVGDLLRQYLAENPECYLAKSPKRIREFLAAFEFYAPNDISEVTLRSFLIQMKTENEYSEKTMLQFKFMYQGFFKFLVKRQIIDRSPLASIKFDRGTPFRRKPTILSDHEIRSAIRLAKKYSPALFYPIFLLVNETAAKTADIIALQRKDANLKTRVLSLVRSTELQPRTFIMSDDLMTAIKALEPAGEFVFTSLEGKKLERSILGRELKRFQRHVKLPTTWGLRDLRASFAARLLRAGGSIEALQKIMGHVRPYQTEEVYGRYRTGDAGNFLESAAVQGTEAVS